MKKQKYIVKPIYHEIYAVGNDQKSFALWGVKNTRCYPIKLE